MSEWPSTLRVGFMVILPIMQYITASLTSLFLFSAPFAWQLRDGVKELTFEDWLPNEPNDANNNEACGHYWGPHDLKWNDAHCNMHAAYVCEYKGDWTGEK